MTQSKFAKLPMQCFFPLYKAYRIWPTKFLEDYLAQYEVQRGIKICDGTWKSFFMDVSLRLLWSMFHEMHVLQWTGFLTDILGPMHTTMWRISYGRWLIDTIVKAELEILFLIYWSFKYQCCYLLNQEMKLQARKCSLSSRSFCKCLSERMPWSTLFSPKPVPLWYVNCVYTCTYVRVWTLDLRSINNMSILFTVLCSVIFIRESVDSLCKGGTNPPMVYIHWKALSHEHSCSKHFCTPSYPIPPFLYPMIPLMLLRLVSWSHTYKFLTW